MSFLSKLLEPVRANPRLYIKGMLMRCIIIGTEIICIFILQKIAYFVQYQDLVSIKSRTIALVLINLSAYGLKYLTRARWWPTSQIASETFLREKYFKHLARIQNSYLEKIGTGKLIELVKYGIDTWRRTIELLAQICVEFPLKIGFSLYMVSQLGSKVLAGYICCLVMMGCFSYYMNQQSNKKRGNRKSIEMAMTRRFIRFLMARLEIIQSNKIQYEIQQQHQDVQALGNINIQVNKYLNLMYQTPITVVYFFAACIGRYAYTGLMQGNFQYAIFTGLVSVVGYMLSMVVYMSSKFKDLTKDIVHVEKLREHIDHAPLMENFDSGDAFLYQKGDIEIKNLSFQYNDGIQVFDNFSLTLQGGKKTAFVGNSGSGKSTLVKLISGLLSPDKGQVLIDDQDLSEVSLKSFYQHIGFLQQEPIIFDGTVRENILYGLSNNQDTKKTNGTAPSLDKGRDGEGFAEQNTISDQQLHTIISQSQCHFIYDLPQGLDTEVGERGIRLSGGQKQRLAIARIFAKNPDIIILDEPTSALDSFAEEEITKALHILCEGKTVLIIAHRLQTVKEADEIIVLSPSLDKDQKQGFNEKNWVGGRFDDQKDQKLMSSGSIILERGTHSSLIEQNGHYAKMLELQAGF